MAAPWQFATWSQPLPFQWARPSQRPWLAVPKKTSLALVPQAELSSGAPCGVFQTPLLRCIQWPCAPHAQMSEEFTPHTPAKVSGDGSGVLLTTCHADPLYRATNAAPVPQTSVGENPYSDVSGPGRPVAGAAVQARPS